MGVWTGSHFVCPANVPETAYKKAPVENHSWISIGAFIFCGLFICVSSSYPTKRSNISG